ncbi:MAG: ribonucleotide reductase N-terminal alpha domain-containing protein [Methanothrix sp.]|nr:ribonucleotide reductase N-terminal alpha domain-containing protein [Bacteroidales bacterium]MDD2753945.1 ribonucleotide reductase N-terminal alpha domain-containing protein [Methanothrix sp.]
MRQIAEDVLRARYYQPGERGWYDIAGRVSAFIAKDTESATAYFEAMNSLELIPNSPALMNAGTEKGGSLSACYAVPVYDSIEDIFDAVKACALIHKQGGGTGLSLSRLRPKGSDVKGTGKISSGPVSFMHVFNAATETIKQGGKRRGANLGSLDVHHPDIKEFITCKSKEGELSNFNISVIVDDEFMKNPDPEVWDLIVEGNWKNGEPGILFKDARERDNKRPDLGELSETNPCGETALFPWESCNLASINLMKCVINDKFDYEKFYSLVRLGVQFLNDMLDKNRYPLPQIEEATKKTRKIGLGVMGFADVLIALGMRYGDDESLQFANDLFGNMRQVAEHESALIGGNNAALLSIAPTGSISLFAGVSSGIEPNFGYVYDRTTHASGEKVKYREIHPMFEAELNKDAEEWMMQYGTLNGCGSVSDLMKDLFVTAKDIKPRDHVRMQAVIQKHVDQALSKTLNCPTETTKEEISNLIQFAWREGCKGLTIYREGSRSDVVLETNAAKPKEEVKEKEKEPIEIPSEIDLKSIRMNSACGVLWVKTGFLHGSATPVEVWIDAEKGGCRANLEFIARLISKLLQEGVSHEVACKQGDKVFCPACVNNAKGEAEGYSCANLISKGIKEGIKRREEDLKNADIDYAKGIIKVWNDEAKKELNDNMCPDCGAQLIHIEGCKSCQCGYSRCK